MKYKVGQVLRVTGKYSRDVYINTILGYNKETKEYRTSWYQENKTTYKGTGGYTLEPGLYEIEIIKSSKYKKLMDLKSKFTGLFLQEPEKTFRKAGITTEGGELTEDGQEIFLQWLLKLNGDAFKTEVVDPILAAEMTVETTHQKQKDLPWQSSVQKRRPIW